MPCVVVNILNKHMHFPALKNQIGRDLEGFTLYVNCNKLELRRIRSMKGKAFFFLDCGFGVSLFWLSTRLLFQLFFLTCLNYENLGFLMTFPFIPFGNHVFWAVKNLRVKFAFGVAPL